MGIMYLLNGVRVSTTDVEENRHHYHFPTPAKEDAGSGDTMAIACIISTFSGVFSRIVGILITATLAYFHGCGTRNQFHSSRMCMASNDFA